MYIDKDKFTDGTVSNSFRLGFILVIYLHLGNGNRKSAKRHVLHRTPHYNEFEPILVWLPGNKSRGN